MKIAFDLHGVITSHPNFFKTIMQSLVKEDRNPLFNFEVKSSNEVWIISGPPINEVENELKELGIKKDIHYHKIDTIISWLLRNTHLHHMKVWKDENGWWVEDENYWNKIKSYICLENQIDYLIDDTEVYKEHFDNNEFCETEFILWGKGKKK